MTDSDVSSYKGSYDGSSDSSDDVDGEGGGSHESDDTSEMMVIEIAFGKGKEDKIVVHWNDDPLELAKKHGMKQAAVSAIAAHISSTIEEFKVTNAELRPQSPSLDESYTSQSKEYASYNDVQYSHNEPVDLPQPIQPLQPHPLNKLSSSHPPKSTVRQSPMQQPTGESGQGQVDSSMSSSRGPRNRSPSPGKYEAKIADSDNVLKSSPEEEEEDGGNDVAAPVNEDRGEIKRTDSPRGLSEDLVNLSKESDSSPLKSASSLMSNLKAKAVSGVNTAEKRDKIMEQEEVPHEELFKEPSPEDGYEDQDESDEQVKQKRDSAVYARIKNSWRSRGQKSAPKNSSRPVPLSQNVVLRSSLVLSKSQRESHPNSPTRPTKAKNASDRLYHNAEVQSKRRELLKAREDAKNDAVIHAGKFQMSASSRAVVRSICVTSGAKNITERLYDQGVKKKKEKEAACRKREEELRVEATSWSCLQCGTHHQIGSGQRMIMNDKREFKLNCDSCGYSCEAPLMPFQPTNINSHRSGLYDKETIRNRKKQDPIHEYLFANRELQAKKGYLVKHAWGDEDEIFTFKPVIPESSKALVRKHRNSEMHSTSGIVGDSPSKHKKITVAAEGLDKYLSLPITERLIVGETLCRQSEPGKVPKRKTIRKEVDAPPQPVKRTESETEETYARLVNEFWEIRARRERAEKLALKYDLTTRKRLFKPTRGPPPESEAFRAVIEDEAQEEIHEKLLRAGVEHNRRIETMQRKYTEKQMHEIEEQKVQALPRSREILESSMQQNSEEIFKILVAHQELILEMADQGEPLNSTTDRIAEKIMEMSSKISNDWRNLHVDVRLMDSNILVEDIRELMADVQQRGLRHVLKRKTTGDRMYSIGYATFVALIKACLKKRDGVGRAYIYAPKPRDDVTRHLLEVEAEQATFRPVIEKRSAALAKRKGRSGDQPIEDILRNDGDASIQRIECAREQLESEKFKDCSFHPTLYKPPREVMPTYRGQQKEERFDSPPKPMKKLTGGCTYGDVSLSDYPGSRSIESSRIIQMKPSSKKPVPGKGLGVCDMFSNTDSRVEPAMASTPPNPQPTGNSVVDQEDSSLSAYSSVSSSPPSANMPPDLSRKVTKVEVIRNQKASSRKNSWHGALATGWMGKEK